MMSHKACDVAVPSSGGTGPLAQVSISVKGRCEIGASDNARGASRCE